ncbi:PhoX family protein [Polaromonas eurypsychrophila]|uniref:Tat pathway signal protein n=1 Tax=Polaromonas eurypsychrophila TaxID=1614635 RepID=A0A916SM02_9BURK|nr:PhoX family phosphatase [Polaromonas eurypsychrophila]GGB06661.1 Tat pathway signal protein [Polaromonas eurypsychrophila]
MGQGFGKAYEPEEGVNTTGNPSIHEVDGGRRHVLRCTSAAVALLMGSHTLTGHAATAAKGKSLGFTSVPVSSADALVVPPEYEAQVLYRWGDATGVAGAAAPTFAGDASNSVQEQLLQAGMHHDGMEYFPLDKNPRHGLLAINHEYTDDGLLHSDGMKTWTAEKVRKSQAAHGVSIIEVVERGGVWRVMPNSRYARRITATTPMAFSGPAAGHALLKTAADPEGARPLGTLNNCAAGQTPWGTFLTCEENWNGYFSAQDKPTPDELRYGLRSKGFGYRWHEFDERFDAVKTPNEQNRFGWVVEIDPQDPTQTPIKRTALGRIKHEGATTTLSRDGRAVVYMGDDERFEYVYKFVSRDKVKPGGYRANRELLDHGTLYVARFDAQGYGRWLPLVHGEDGLTAVAGFPSQAEVVIKCRQAADAVGATKMDRPEWVAVHPNTGEVFLTLTNNSARGQGGRMADASNPRNDNIMGHIIRWREGKGQGGSGAFDGDASATEFRWMHFALAGDPNADKAEYRGTIKGDMYGSPDGLQFDAGGLLWIQTDVSTSAMHKGAYAGMGNNMMLCADPATGETKRFLTGPAGCEITGVTFTPDRRAVFINIQHPGETASERGDPAQPKAVSHWPDGPTGGRPRSATVVIRRKDGGTVGT